MHDFYAVEYAAQRMRARGGGSSLWTNLPLHCRRKRSPLQTNWVISFFAHGSIHNLLENFSTFSLRGKISFLDDSQILS
jgi:hypothetical protein